MSLRKDFSDAWQSVIANVKGVTSLVRNQEVDPSDTYVVSPPTGQTWRSKVIEGIIGMFAILMLFGTAFIVLKMTGRI
jgi:hypothetical protein